ncbi:hypothetical protein ACGGKE_16350 (plasmid) [Sphingobium naphthae]|uniref:hypothetical protein n=1 Tax=Sphingobium naphthae TaxID=1886786 RepID=UPI0037478649
MSISGCPRVDRIQERNHDRHIGLPAERLPDAAGSYGILQMLNLGVQIDVADRASLFAAFATSRPSTIAGCRISTQYRQSGRWWFYALARRPSPISGNRNSRCAEPNRRQQQYRARFEKRCFERSSLL